MHAHDVTDADLYSFVKQHPLVVLDAWAPWCAPCHKLEPILREVVAEYGGAVKLAKLNGDENPRTMQALDILGMPTLVFFRDGQRVAQVSGFQPKAALKQKLGAAFGL